MAANNGMMTGLIAAVVIGSLGGGGVHVLAARVSLPQPPSSAPAQVPPRLQVGAVSGSARALTIEGNWRGLGAGTALARPTGIETSGVDGRVDVSHGPTTVRISREARVHFNATGKALKLYLEQGRVVIRRPAGQISTMVPGASLTVSGQSYGVWVRPDRTVIAVLEGELTLTRQGKETTYAAGREIVVSAASTTYGVFPPRLAVFLERKERAGSGYAVRGKTSPNAQVMVLSGGSYEEVPITVSGVFETRIADADPAPKELIVFDAAGRQAEVGKPSQASGEAVEALGKKRRKAHAAPPAAEPKAAAPAPVKRRAVAAPEPAPAVRAPEPAVVAPSAPAAPALEKKELEVKLPELSPPPEVEVEPVKRKTKRESKRRSKRAAKPKAKKSEAKAEPKPEPAASPKPDEENIELEWD